jgi:hypothetical protein
MLTPTALEILFPLPHLSDQQTLVKFHSILASP